MTSLLRFCAWLYLAVVVAVWVVLRTGGERWWWATVLLFAPRWIWAAPLAIGVTAALWKAKGRRQKAEVEEKAEGRRQKAEGSRWPLYLPITLAAVWVAGPLMGFCFSWQGIASIRSNVESPKSEVPHPSPLPEGEGTRSSRQSLTPNPQSPTTLRVLTCNVGIEGYDEAALARLVRETMPDVVTLQEGYGEWPFEGTGNRAQGTEPKAEGRRQKAEDDGGKGTGDRAQGTGEDGLGRPSSVAPSLPLSPSPPRSASGPQSPTPSPQPPTWHVSASPGIMIASRFPILSQQTLAREDDYGPRTVGVAYRLDTPEGEITFVALHLYTPRDGLMSIPLYPGEDADYLRANTAWRVQESADASRWVAGLAGPVIVAGDMNLPPESEMFRRDWSGYTDAFSAAGFGYGYTYGYDASHPFWGIRIDHILAGNGWRAERCWIGPHVGSDHRPVLADLRRGGQRHDDR